MGEVYRGTMSTIDGVTKAVAIKLVRPELAADSTFGELFVGEARIAMSLSHANVVQSFDVGTMDSRYYLAMEYVDGPDLDALMVMHRRSRGTSLPLRHAVFIAVEVLKGLDYAHRRTAADGAPLGIVHRDISPSNILISREGEVKVADFGIAKSATRSAAHSGPIRGKIPYMAPEQLRGVSVDRRADLYAVGAVLLEMITGEAAFGAETDAELIARVLAGDFTRPRVRAPEVPDALERIVLRAMSLEPTDRYMSAAAMRQELEQLALASGYLLSSTDLADLIVELGLEKERSVPETAPVRSARSMSLALPNLETEDESFESAGDALDALLGPARTRPIAPVAEAPLPPREADRPVARGSRAKVFAVSGIALALCVGAAWVILADPSRPRATEAAAEPKVGATLRPPPQAATPPAPRSPRDPEPNPPTVDLVGQGSAAPPSLDAPLAGKRVRPRRSQPRGAPALPSVTPTAVPSTIPPSTSTAATPSALISVNSEPWSYVAVDGREIRATPLLRHRVTPGTHRITLRTQTSVRDLVIDLAPDEHRRISVDLDPHE